MKRPLFAVFAPHTLKMNNATADCMGNSVCASDRVEFVHHCTHVKLGSVDRNAKTASYRLVRHPLSEKS